MRVGSGSVPVLYAISALDGRPIWQNAITNNISEVIERGQLVNDTLYITTTVLQDNNSEAGLYAYNIRINKLQWSKHFSNNVQALNSVVQDGRIYLETIGSPRQGSQESVLTIYALDAQKQGAVSWKYELTSYNVADFALVNKAVYIVSAHYESQKNRPTIGYGIAVALNSESGKVNWLRRINSPGAISIDQVNETELYIDGLDGRVYDFRVTDGTLLNTFTVNGGIFKFQVVS
jgi:outer membrane protein assembly factor BamB